MWEALKDCGEKAKRWEGKRMQSRRYKQTECTVRERTQVGRGPKRTQRLSVAFRREVSESRIFFFFPSRIGQGRLTKGRIVARLALDAMYRVA